MGAPVTDVAALARLAGFEIPPQFEEGVAIQLAAVQVQAKLVLDFSLDEETEPAPIFLP